jgi:hypothetical protein
VDVIIADDGLQHLRLARDFEIAVIDARADWATAICCRPVRCASRPRACRRSMRW